MNQFDSIACSSIEFERKQYLILYSNLAKQQKIESIIILVNHFVVCLKMINHYKTRKKIRLKIIELKLSKNFGKFNTL